MDTRLQKRRRLETPIENIGYKKAAEGYIVKLEILGKSNETRENIVDPVHAKYRCSKAKVLDIFHWQTDKKIDLITGLHDPNFSYKLGEVIESEFDNKLANVCSTGIHYFKTLEQAKNWHLPPPSDGKVTDYHDNGRIYCEVNYKNGKAEGYVEEYYDNGNIAVKCYYKNGHFDGICEDFYLNGNKRNIQIYKNGKQEGRWEHYNLDGTLHFYTFYKNDCLIPEPK